MYSDGSSSGYYPSCTNSVVSPVTRKAVDTGAEWQCVELVNRLYITNGWITTTWHGDGDTMWKKAPPGPNGVPLESQPQGSISYLASGDVVSIEVQPPPVNGVLPPTEDSGHVLIVSAVSGTSITFVSQNAGKNTAATVISYGTLSGGKLKVDPSGSWTYPVDGVVHAPKTGAVYAWGFDRDGELANANVDTYSGEFLESDVPVEIPGLTGVTAMAGSADGGTAYALRDDGTVLEWGLGYSDVPTEVKGLKNVVAVAAGSSTGYALRDDGTVWAWGYGQDGELGNGKEVDSATPVRVLGLANVKAIAAGWGSGYALLSNGTVASWGDDRYGALGNGTVGVNRDRPAIIKNLNNVVAVAGSPDFDAYAVLADGSVRSWGVDTDGQLGNGTSGSASNTNPFSDTPVDVRALNDAVELASTVGDTYAVLRNGTVWAWGSEDAGYGGTGSSSPRNVDVLVPERMKELTNIEAVAAGNQTAYALSRDGSVWAWGENAWGELGDGKVGNESDVPAKVVGLSNVSVIAANWPSAYAVIGG